MKTGTDESLSGEGVATGATPGADATPDAPAEPAAATGKAKDDDKPFTMKPSAWRQQVAEKEAKAREDLAISLGYASLDEMKTTLARHAAAQAQAATPAKAAAKASAKAPVKAPVKPTAETPTGDAAPSDASPELRVELAELRAKHRTEIATSRQSRQDVRAMQAELERLKVEHEAEISEAQLRDAAREQGVVGDYVDDVMSRLRKKLASMDDDEIATFNEDEWIASLKEKHPFWFGVKEQPANAGHADRQTPPKPKPDEATKTAAAAGAFNALTASKDEVQKRIIALGLRPKFQN